MLKETVKGMEKVQFYTDRELLYAILSDLESCESEQLVKAVRWMYEHADRFVKKETRIVHEYPLIASILMERLMQITLESAMAMTHVQDVLGTRMVRETQSGHIVRIHPTGNIHFSYPLNTNGSTAQGELDHVSIMGFRNNPILVGFDATVLTKFNIKKGKVGRSKYAKQQYWALSEVYELLEFDKMVYSGDWRIAHAVVTPKEHNSLTCYEDFDKYPSRMIRAVKNKISGEIRGNGIMIIYLPITIDEVLKTAHEVRKRIHTFFDIQYDHEN